jgi:hypothetical protein
MIKKVIGRPINGIGLNGLEYLLDGDGEFMTFDNQKEAMDYLINSGISESAVLEDYWFKDYDTKNNKFIE